ncbi:MAG: DMT family transporter [Paracoccaceae bacterium]
MRSGVLLLLVAMSLTPALDGIAKDLGDLYSPLFICFLRYFSAGVLALGIASASGTPVTVPREDRFGQVFRTALMMAAMTALIAALGMVPMANAVGGFLIAPVVATLLSVVLLGEAMTLPKLAGSLVSFLGAFLIMRPEGGLETGTILAMAGGVLLGCYLAATRAAPPSSGPLVTLVVQSLLGSALIAPFVFSQGVPEISPALFLGALGLGGLSAASHFLTVAAYSRAEASVLSPFLYFNLLASVAAGFFWFGELPNMVSVLGLTGIAAGGLLTIVPIRAILVRWTVQLRADSTARAGN